VEEQEDDEKGEELGAEALREAAIEQRLATSVDTSKAVVIYVSRKCCKHTYTRIHEHPNTRDFIVRL
jgi:hypothetical protein